MKTNIKNLLSAFVLFFAISSCNEKDYSLGDLTAPSNIVINAEIVGATAASPNGDGSGDVNFTITADIAL